MLKTAKVVGLNSDSEAALAGAWVEGGVGLYLVVSCSGEEAFSRTRQALTTAQELFYSSDLSLTQKLNEIFLSVSNSLSGSANLQILAASTCADQAGSVLYLLCRGGDLVAYLLRGGKQTDLAGVGDGQLVSGILQPGDRVVLSTRSLIELLSSGAGALGSFPIEGLEDEVAAHLPEADPYPVAAVVVEEEVPEEIEAAGQPTAFRIRKMLPRSGKGLAILAAAVFLAAGLGWFVHARSGQQAATRAGFESDLRQAEEEFGKAQSEKDSDPQAAAASLSAAKAAVAAALKIKPQEPQALDLKKRLEDQTGDILKIYQVDNLSLWLDLDLIKKGLAAKKLSLSHGSLLILDEGQKVLAEVGLDNKSQQILAGPDKLGEAGLASLNGDTAFVYSADKGVVKVDAKSKQTAVAVKPDPDWGKVSGLYGFAGNIYLLDDGKNQIWKYLPVASGYSDKQSYFKEGVKANLGNVSSLQIDSSVWILKSGGEIAKYTQGAPDFFSLSGLDKPVKDPKSFFVSSETDNLYLLDNGNNRLLVLDKKGVYQSQYRSDKLGNFTDLAVDEKGKKVYLLDGSKIYLMELK